MSRVYSIEIKKDIAQQCIDWNALKLNFVSKHAAKGDRSKKSYSAIISSLIHEKYGAKMRVNDGKAIGRRWVSIYLQCSHGNKFLAQISRSKFVANKNLEFILSRSRNGLKSCDCGKKKKKKILSDIHTRSFQKLIQLMAKKLKMTIQTTLLNQMMQELLELHKL